VVTGRLRPTATCVNEIFAKRSTSNIPAKAWVVILPRHPESTMNKQDSDRIHELCSLIEHEQNAEKFIILVKELNQILTGKSARLQSENATDPGTV
jgi:hypothetical protein